jgi:hypothetical protein
MGVFGRRTRHRAAARMLRHTFDELRRLKVRQAGGAIKVWQMHLAGTGNTTLMVMPSYYNLRASPRLPKNNYQKSLLGDKLKNNEAKFSLLLQQSS